MQWPVFHPRSYASGFPLSCFLDPSIHLLRTEQRRASKREHRAMVLLSESPCVDSGAERSLGRQLSAMVADCFPWKFPWLLLQVLLLVAHPDERALGFA